MLLLRMSIAGAVFALAGCADGISLPALASASGAPTMALLGGDFIAAGPDGYCVDPNGSRPQKGFAIMAPCSVLGIEDVELRVHAVTTIQVGAQDSAIVAQDAAAFAAYLQGPDGPLVLSRIGDADTVVVRNVVRRGDYVTVSLIDEAPAAMEGVQEAEWRAFVDVAGRLVTIAVRGLDAAPLTDGAGEGLLGQSVNAVVQANITQPATDS